MKNLISGILLLAIASFISFAGHAEESATVDTTAPIPLSSNQILAKGRWKAFIARHAKVCDPRLDSVAIFTPGSTKVAVVFHGLGASPRSLSSTIQLLKSQGFNVLAPRLTGNYDQNLTSLDQVKYDAWVRDSEEVFDIARIMGTDITLVGHSLGGILASRLAIRYYNHVARAILFAPAWRINPTVSLGSMLGSLIHENLNHFTNTPIACRPGLAYIPASAGREIENLIEGTEREFGAAYSTTKPTTSIFARMYVPHILITSPQDEALDISALTAMCGWASGQCAEISVPTAHHANIVNRLDRVADGKFLGQTLRSILLRFLNPPTN